MEYIIILIVIVIIVLVVLFNFRNKKKKLTISQKKEITRFFNKIKKSESNKEKIIDFDKLYHKIFQEL
jgi:predicted negative regulator of RcsB-dependent stress response